MVISFKKAILLDDTSFPLKEALIDILDDVLEVTATQSCEEAAAMLIDSCDVVISCSSGWAHNIKTAAALYDYVLYGGCLFCIHNGTDMRGSHELCNVIGARMEGHEALTHLDYESTSSHPMAQDIPNFELVEQPFRYTFDAYTQNTVTLEYHYGVLRYPAMWVHEFGAGKVICLVPGRNEKNLNVFPLKKLVYWAVCWLCGEKTGMGIC